MRTFPIVGGDREAFNWRMDDVWYQYHKGVVNKFVESSKEIILNHQQFRLTMRFGDSFLHLERQWTNNMTLVPDKYDRLMMAALRFGTCPSLRYTHCRVQMGSYPILATLGPCPNPKVHWGVQTRYSSIAPPIPEPPEPLETIDEDGEYSDVETTWGEDEMSPESMLEELKPSPC